MLCAPYPSHRSDTIARIIDLVRSAKYRSPEEKYGIVYFVYTKDDRELIHDKIESRAYFLNYKGEVPYEMYWTR
ncbi:MAG: hypothetical protein ABSF09_00005, partial [Candidatus Bathyarchaeia archaeon]|jgi:hypothetical protein